MHYRIVKRKLSFYHHLMSLEHSSVASRVARVEERAGYPGLVSEYKTLCVELGLPDPNTFSKASWKNKVKQAVAEANKNCLLEEIKHYKKLDYNILKEEKFGIRDYVKNMNSFDARKMFSIRSKMLKGVKFNYSNDPENIRKSWICTNCDKIDSQAHILICESYTNLRDGKDMKKDKDLVTYFKEVMNIREKIENLV